MRHQSIPATGRTVSAAVISLVCLLAPASLHAWASTGHRIVAEVAQRHLDPAFAASLTSALGGRGLAELATWPDDIRSDPRWSCSAPFHYLTVPDGADYFAHQESLGAAERPAGDSVRALVYFESVLVDPATSPREKVRALSFLVHIVGDMHQPLHNGRGCDRGGNGVDVSFFGEPANLHKVWDGGLIASEKLSYTEFATFVDHPGTAEVVALQAQSPLEWVTESRRLLDGIYTCDASAGGDRCTCFCGDCADGNSVFGGCRAQSCAPFQAGTVELAYGYKSRHMDTLRAQLVAGGVRLAGLLNRILADDPSIYPGHASYQAFVEQVKRMRNWRRPIRRCMRIPDYP